MTDTKDLAKLEAAFRTIYQRELPLLERLLAALKDRRAVSEVAADGADWKGGGAITKRAKLLTQVYERGLASVLGRRASAASQGKILQLVEEFTRLGAQAAISVGPQRAGDFLNNQLRGRWAEVVVLSLKVPGLTLVPFGPSGAAMPGDEDHRAVVSTYAAISLLEGKRPDVLGFDSALYSTLDAADRERIRTWPTRLLDTEDHKLIGKAICALEVKNSLWHYGERRKHSGQIDEGDRPLSITLKEEEVGPFQRWRDRTGVPVVFVQVLFEGSQDQEADLSVSVGGLQSSPGGGPVPVRVPSSGPNPRRWICGATYSVRPCYRAERARRRTTGRGEVRSVSCLRNAVKGKLRRQPVT